MDYNFKEYMKLLLIPVIPEKKFIENLDLILSSFSLDSAHISLLLPSSYKSTYNVQVIHTYAEKYSKDILIPSILDGAFEGICVVYQGAIQNYDNVLQFLFSYPDILKYGLNIDGLNKGKIDYAFFLKKFFSVPLLRQYMFFLGFVKIISVFRIRDLLKSWGGDSLKASCRVCASRKYSFLYSVRLNSTKHNLYKCAVCDYIHITPSVSDEQIQDYFHGYGSYGDEKYFERTYERFLNHKSFALIEANVDVNKPVRFLEIGCGSGALLKAVAKRYPHWNVVGQEIDLKNAALIRQRTGLEVFTEELSDINFSDKKDVVLAWHVLEHIPFEKFLLVLEKVSNILKDGGVFVGAFPNFNSVQHKIVKERYENLHIIDHNNMLSKKNFTYLLEKYKLFSQYKIFSGWTKIGFDFMFASDKLKNIPYKFLADLTDNSSLMFIAKK